MQCKCVCKIIKFIVIGFTKFYVIYFKHLLILFSCNHEHFFNASVYLKIAMKMHSHILMDNNMSIFWLPKAVTSTDTVYFLKPTELELFSKLNSEMNYSTLVTEGIYLTSVLSTKYAI